jgi:hypothetical protein
MAEVLTAAVYISLSDISTVGSVHIPSLPRYFHRKRNQVPPCEYSLYDDLTEKKASLSVRWFSIRSMLYRYLAAYRHSFKRFYETIRPFYVVNSNSGAGTCMVTFVSLL